MKKLALLSMLTVFALSCGTPKTVVETKKILKGYWMLDNISYSESGTFTVQLLNDTSRECFEGSMWRFIPNNNTGKYTIDDSNCPTGERNFIFAIQEIDQATGLYDFLLKPTDEKKRSADNKGFRLRLARMTGSNMVWEQTVSLEGKPFTISMNFTKAQE
ncbi:MAG: lipocalin family protein [Bacteroidota bacterium]